LVLLHQICLVYPAFSGEAFLAKIIEITTSKTE